MFDLDWFAADWRSALAEDKGGHRTARDVVESAASDPSTVLVGLSMPKRAKVEKLFRTLVVAIRTSSGERMTIIPHNHCMWAVISAYTGREDNTDWRRRNGAGGKAEAVRAHAACRS